MRSTSVLIVGAGPTGLTLALELSVQNIPFILIDALPTPAPHSRALILHCRSVELLSRHPLVVSTILPLCKQNLGISIYVNKKKAFEMDLKKEGFGALDTEFNGPYFISQNVTESILEKQLVEYGGKLERGVKATSIVQDSEGVTVMTRKVREDSYEEPGEEEIRCKYIVGCDGAHSAVRKSTGLKFEGGAYAQDFLLADVSMKWNYATDRMAMLMGNEFMMCLPLMDGKYRLVLSQPSSKNGVAVEDEPTLQDFRDAFSRLAEGEVKIEDPPIWMSRFKLHHRTVEAYRKDRVFVAGDAAHIHSPAGGQGMNTGIQDAINLGWKLGMVLRNEKPDSFLDAYSIERHRVGINLLKGTDKVFEFMATTNPLYLFMRNTIFPWVAPLAFKSGANRARRYRFVSQLGIRYRHSPIVKTASMYPGPRQGGDRAPDGRLQLPGKGDSTNLYSLLTGPTHHLVLFSGLGKNSLDSEELLETVGTDFPEKNENWLKIHRVTSLMRRQEGDVCDNEGILHERYGFVEQPGYVLIRPDLYIGYIGTMQGLGEWKASLLV
ncbi:FAD binding domain-containing protein [Rutstroemia sp. NJR-2017a WRK4]|nr:FAD binding domain-containing protein [Rutstroemia sp. NJR-2017a WRK4]PQE33127.1 FAD binding domain-containing protein [Rutstroemia sp. NJR-2017a WRK4]